MTTEVCRHSCNVSHWRRPSHPHSTFFDYKSFFFEGNMACFCVHVIWVLQWGKVFARHDWASAVGPHAISPWSAKAQLSETGLKHDPRHQDIVLLWWRGGKLFLQKFSPYFFWIGCPGRHPLLIFFLQIFKTLSLFKSNSTLVIQEHYQNSLPVKQLLEGWIVGCFSLVLFVDGPFRKWKTWSFTSQFTIRAFHIIVRFVINHLNSW